MLGGLQGQVNHGGTAKENGNIPYTPKQMGLERTIVLPETMDPGEVNEGNRDITPSSEV
jgi:hypothetical protein